MVDFVFVYLDALLVSGFEFFKLALPLIILYFLITKLREIWDEGSFFEILLLAVFQGGGLVLGLHHGSNGGSVLEGMLIIIGGIILGFYFSGKFWPPPKKTKRTMKIDGVGALP